MPVPWFTVEEEKPDIGTVIFKADDYYERLQHISGMWNDNIFLHYDMFQSPRESSEEEDPTKEVDPSKIFQAGDISNVPQLLAYLERANLKGAVPPDQLDIMWDLHKLYIKKMSEFGYATRWMSKKEFTFLENRERWAKLFKAMEELQQANIREAEKVKKRKRMLKPTVLKVINRIEDIPGIKINQRSSLVALKPAELKIQKKMQKNAARKKPKLRKNSMSARKSRQRSLHGKASTLSIDLGGTLRSKDKDVKKMSKDSQDKGGASASFFHGKKQNGPYDWDYGKTRLFDRRNVKLVSRHFEFSRIYQKIAKSIRFSRNEPVDWRTITIEEIDKHRSSTDCWMAIKGKVFDVTEYLKDHPGGGHLVMQGAGTDATNIFVAVHPYVVFYQDLAGKQIGTLPDYEEHHRTEWEPPQDLSVLQILKQWYYRPKHQLTKCQPKTTFQQNETSYIYTVIFPKHLVSREEDWTITVINGFTVTVSKFVHPPYVWYSGFDLRTKVMDDTVYRTFSEDFNSVEVTISKSYKVRVKKPIKDRRQNDRFFLSSYSMKEMYRASVVERTSVADGVKLYGITVGMNKLLGCPIGCYVNIRILDEMRPYTPVCLPDEYEYKFEETSGDFQTLFFIIKEFKDGDFTSMLHHLPIKKILVGVDIYISPPMGNFKVDFLFSNMDVMLLVAGGTGISVMTRIIQEYIQHADRLKRGEKSVCLFHFVQGREDLIWKEVWTELAEKFEWFYYFISLTRVYRYTTVKKEKGPKGVGAAGKKEKEKKNKPVVLEFDPNSSHEMYGYPADSKLEHIFKQIPGSTMPEKLHKACVCGPYGFNHSCSLMLTQYGKHEKENVHYFAG